MILNTTFPSHSPAVKKGNLFGDKYFFSTALLRGIAKLPFTTLVIEYIKRVS